MEKKKLKEKKSNFQVLPLELVMRIIEFSKYKEILDLRLISKIFNEAFFASKKFSSMLLMIKIREEMKRIAHGKKEGEADQELSNMLKDLSSRLKIQKDKKVFKVECQSLKNYWKRMKKFKSKKKEKEAISLLKKVELCWKTYDCVDWRYQISKKIFFPEENVSFCYDYLYDTDDEDAFPASLSFSCAKKNYQIWYGEDSQEQKNDKEKGDRFEEMNNNMTNTTNLKKVMKIMKIIHLSESDFLFAIERIISD